MKVTSTQLNESERSNLVKILVKLAPSVAYSSDLTSEVGVLVANPTRGSDWLNSNKFQYVIQHRPSVKVVRYESILERYEQWLKGEEVDSEEDVFETLKSVTVFDGLEVCVSRVGKNDVVKLVRDHGGMASESLSKSTDVLVTADPAGKRYKHAKSWGIAVVSPDWCYDSVERGAALAFKYYMLRKKDGKGRKAEACEWDAWREWKKQAREDQVVKRAKRKQIDEPDEEEREFKVAKLDKGDHLWNSIMKEAGVGSQSLDLGGDDGRWESEQKVTVEESLAMVSTQRQEHEEHPEKSVLLLEGLSFTLHGFSADHEKILRAVLTDYGATVSRKDAKYTVVSSELDTRPDISAESVWITEHAIERCVYFHDSGRLEDREGRPLFTKDLEVASLRSALEFAGSSKITVAITGFTGIDMTQFQTLLKKKLSRFFEFRDRFTKDCELLIVADSSGENTVQKIKMAQKWEVKLLHVGEFWTTVDALVE